MMFYVRQRAKMTNMCAWYFWLKLTFTHLAHFLPRIGPENGPRKDPRYQAMLQQAVNNRIGTIVIDLEDLEMWPALESGRSFLTGGDNDDDDDDDDEEEEEDWIGMHGTRWHRQIDIYIYTVYIYTHILMDI